MDFVFSDSPDGGAFYDNNNGMDYHTEVANSTITPAPLSVCHIAVEMAPIAKVCSLLQFKNWCRVDMIHLIAAL